MPSNIRTPEEVAALNLKAEFNKNKEVLFAYCEKAQLAGMKLSDLVLLLNAEGKRTRSGQLWTYETLYSFTQNYQKYTFNNPVSLRPEKTKRRIGLRKTHDINLPWVTETYPELEEWRKLGSGWLRSLETSLGLGVLGVNHFITFLAETGAPTSPLLVMQFRTKLPDFYQTRWGANLTKGHILVNNQVHYFLEWVLKRPEYCGKDNGGKFVTRPAFSNPVKLLRPRSNGSARVERKKK